MVRITLEGSTSCSARCAQSPGCSRAHVRLLPGRQWPRLPARYLTPETRGGPECGRHSFVGTPVAPLLGIDAILFKSDDSDKRVGSGCEPRDVRSRHRRGSPLRRADLPAAQCGGEAANRTTGPPGCAKLHRCVGARNRPLAALAPGGHRSFPARGRIPSAGVAGAVRPGARGETSWPPRAGRWCGPLPSRCLAPDAGRPAAARTSPFASWKDGPYDDLRHQRSPGRGAQRDPR